VTEGFRVNLVQLQDYINALREAQQTYDDIEDQLVEADLTTADPDFATLVGHPEYGGTQAAFTEACRTFLTTYKNLYTQIHDLHHQISGKLNYMVQEYVETHALYQQVESANALVFDGVHEQLLGGGESGPADTR
jgi:hypothetical protein